MNPQYKKIEKKLAKSPQIAFEYCLLRFRDEKILSEEVWELFFKSILGQKEIHLENNSVSKVIFSQDLEKNVKRFIATCFLRLISVNHFIINTGDSQAISIFKLLDENLADIYKHPQINLSPKDNNVEKSRKLGEVLSERESSLIELKHTLKDLNDINTFKHQFSRKLGDKITKNLLQYFLPKETTNSLQKILIQVLDYQQTEGIKKINSYNLFLEYHQELNDILEAEGNPYWNKMFNSVLNIIHEIVSSDFEATPYSKPALLDIEATDKKYPLSGIGSYFNICLNIINTGIGSAFNVKLSITETSGGVFIEKPTQEITEIHQEQIKVKLGATVDTPIDEVLIDVTITWQNADSSEINKKKVFTLEGQEVDIDWEDLANEDPYSQEPVETELELIGRDSVLKKLFAGISRSKVASYYILGQRRVGKTSLVKTLKSKVDKSELENIMMIYLECGDFKDPTPESTISTLGNKISKAIKIREKKLSNITLPEFNGAFNPITDFFDEVEVLCPELKIIIILDEFDQISPDLYMRTEIANSFFLTLRSISNRSNIGFILVGGEQMELIISCQGEKLNKFRPIRVDYFDREKEWSDFQNLVEKPIEEFGFTISKGVIDKLFEYTEGNPYYTKMICETLFNEMVEKRDAYITPEEVEEAIDHTILSVKKNSFMHFWEDGIKDDKSKKEKISINRRIILKAFAIAKQKWKNELNKEHIVDESINYFNNEIEVRENIAEFERRNIILNTPNIRLKVKLFEEWLLKIGINSLTTSFADPDKNLQVKLFDDSKRVKSNELMELVSRWNNKSYRGEVIQADKIRAWIEQFGIPSKQRVAFTLLQKLTFYDDYIIRVKLKEIYKQAARKLEWHIKGMKKQHVLVSYLDKSVGKSGAEYAKLFVDENNIYVDNIVELGKLPKAIKNEKIKCLVFVDDIIGSGKSICDNLGDLFNDDEIIEALTENPVKIFIGIICGFQKAKAKLERKIKSLKRDIEIHICDILDDTDICFSDSSKFFPDSSSRLEAKAVCYEFGSNLEPKQPLGFSDSQTLIVFPKTCPNNTLPVLWKKTKDWIPLFERPGASK